jgi:hypothetical protein
MLLLVVEAERLDYLKVPISDVEKKYLTMSHVLVLVLAVSQLLFAGLHAL